MASSLFFYYFNKKNYNTYIQISFEKDGDKMKKFLITKDKIDLKKYYKKLWDNCQNSNERGNVKKDFYSEENKIIFTERELDDIWESITRKFQRLAVDRLYAYLDE